jgi:cbb3-type cytochrome oxidase maturation protein
MEILYLLIPIALIFIAIAIAAFVWAGKSGQFDDMEGPAYRILMDDDDPRIPTRRPRRPSEANPQAPPPKGSE